MVKKLILLIHSNKIFRKRSQMLIKDTSEFIETQGLIELTITNLNARMANATTNLAYKNQV